MLSTAQKTWSPESRVIISRLIKKELSMESSAAVADKILQTRFAQLSQPATAVAPSAPLATVASAPAAAPTAAVSAATSMASSIGVKHIGVGLMLTAFLILVIVLTQKKTNKNSKRE